MKINEIVKSNKSDNINEGVGTSLLNLFARTMMAAGGAAAGLFGGALAALFTTPIGYLIGGWAVADTAGATTMALGTAIGAWLGQNHMKKHIQDQDHEWEEVYSVFINGRKASGNDLNYKEAAIAIAQLAAKEHNPKTYYTIYDNSTKSVVWRYVISQDIDSEDEN